MTRATEISDPSWNDVFDRDMLIQSAIANAKPRVGNGIRWAVVRDLFVVGSGTAMELCRQYGFNPHEEIKR